MNKYININNFIQKEYPTTFIIGARGVGKTVQSFVTEIKRCYKNDKKFIYLRRYQTEIETLGIPLQLLSDLTGLLVQIETVKDENGRSVRMITAGIGEEYEDVDDEGNTVKKTKVKNKKNIGYLLALSTASKYKSNDYSNTEIIIYDEFIDIRGRELKNEVNLFLNFAMTVFRDFSKYKALFLANATNMFNCYFIEFNMLPKGQITKNKELGIKIVMYRTSDELNERNKEPLAKLMEFTNPDDSSLSNKFFVNDGYLGKLDANSSCQSVILFDGREFGLWTRGDGAYIVSNKTDKSAKHLSFDDVREDYEYRPVVAAILAQQLIKGNLAFSNEMVRGIWFKMFKEKRLI